MTKINGLFLPLLALLAACATGGDIERMNQGLHRRLDALGSNLKATLDAQTKYQNETSRSLYALHATLDGQIKEIRHELRSMKLTSEALEDLLANNVRQAMTPLNARLDQLIQSQLRAYRMEEAALQQRVGAIAEMLRDMDAMRLANTALHRAEPLASQDTAHVEREPPVEERMNRTR